jgi:hypothetical protein
MIELLVPNNDLKKALTMANSTKGATKNTLESHCLFSFNEGILKILSTNKSTCFSRSILNVTGTGSGSFTVDPTRLLELIRMSGQDIMKIVYHEETTTLEIYASEEADSFISLPSMDVSLYPSIEDNFDKAYEVKTIDAGIFLKGLKFAEGFSIKTTGKFNNVYFSDGVIYGSNGNNQAGAYTSSEFSGLTDLIFPSSAIDLLTNIINKLDFLEVTIKTTSNAIVICSSDYSFGFTKIQVAMPKIPISVDEPTISGWKIEKKPLLKKINRLQTSGESGMGIDMCFSPSKLDLVTKAERPSKETLPCNGSEEAIFTADLWLVEKILGLFEGESLSIYPGKRRINLYTNGNINIMDKDGERQIPFSCSALVALAAEETPK